MFLFAYFKSQLTTWETYLENDTMQSHFAMVPFPVLGHRHGRPFWQSSATPPLLDHSLSPPLSKFTFLFILQILYHKVLYTKVS